MTLNFRFVSVFCLLLASLRLEAQDDIIHENQAWVGYINQSRLNERMSLLNDAHFVPNSFLILRTGATYHFSLGENLKGSTSLGYAHLWLYPPAKSPDPSRNEHRPWGQTTLNHQSGKFGFLHRLRYDARFRQQVTHHQRTDDYLFNWRFRYFVQVRYPLKNFPESGAQLYVFNSNEVLYDAGKTIKNHFRLNQNRYTIGIGYRFSPTLSLQIGYLNMLKKAPSSSTLTMAHTASVMLFHNLDFRTK